MPQRIGLFIALVLLAACSSAPPAKRYAMQGEVRSLDPASKTATINAGKITGWMEAMTMEFPVKPDAEFQKLHVGDHVQGTVVVNDLKYFLTDVTVVPK
jgi:Cu/Ag efflux protein CusF